MIDKWTDRSGDRALRVVAERRGDAGWSVSSRWATMKRNPADPLAKKTAELAAE